MSRLLLKLLACGSIVAGGCAQKRPPHMEAIAELYLSRTGDTVGVDTLADTTRPPAFTPREIDSLTRDWTTEEWLEFWQLVDERRRQK